CRAARGAELPASPVKGHAPRHSWARESGMTRPYTPEPIAPAAKYAPPPAPPLRERLARFRGALAGRLFVLEGAPGIGRTTLLGALLAERTAPWAWCSLDPADAEPARFAATLWDAVSHAPDPVPA